MSEAPVALFEPKSILPPSLSQEKGGASILHALAGDPLWKGRPISPERNDDPCLFIDLASDNTYTFNGKTFKTREMYDPTKNGKEKFSAVIVKSNPLYEDTHQLRDQLTSALLSLKPGGALFVFEKWGTNADKAWREKVLEELGLVKRSIFTSGRKVMGETIWRSQMEKEGLHRTINIYDTPWMKRIIDFMKGKKMQQGYIVTDTSKLEEKLKRSKIPPEDRNLAIDGFGVTLRSRLCPTETCEYEIDIGGNLHVLNSCGEKHSSQNVQEKPSADGKPRCGDCTKPMFWSSKTEMFFCPHCRQ